VALLGGLEVKNTRNLINPDTRLCGMLYTKSGFGKTTCGATLDQMCRKLYGKPALIIALEAADGGGTSSIRKFEVEYVEPQNMREFDALLTGLQTDTTYAGVVLDNATDMVNRIIKPHALTFPTRGAPPPTRATGVPCRDDYQVMGELTRQVLGKLIKLTKLENVKARKHLLVTALEKEKQDDGKITGIHPDLPGAMADASPAMFELVASLIIKNVVVPDPNKPGQTRREAVRVMTTSGDGVKVLKDRYNLFPKECPPDFVEMFEKYWMPAMVTKGTA
jgi:hypothetical protein